MNACFKMLMLEALDLFCIKGLQIKQSILMDHLSARH